MARLRERSSDCKLEREREREREREATMMRLVMRSKGLVKAEMVQSSHDGCC